MVLDELNVRERDGAVERTARLRHARGEETLRIAVPEPFAAAADDATPLLAAGVLHAMRVHEDLEVDGPVSPRLLRRAETLQAAYHAWDMSLRRCSITVAEERAPAGGGDTTASFFSRGVDSLYSAARERLDPGPLSHLVFCQDLEPIHDDRVRTEDLRLAREAAERVGLPLLVISTNVRLVTAPVISWGDYVGAGLAFMALSMAGGVARAVVPSSAAFVSAGPQGSSALLDPLYSTESVTLEHDGLEVGRVGKVAWLAEHRPELLPYIKVCFRENRPDNCGRCGKCLLTMVALHAAGALEQASGFPPRIDAELVAGLGGPPFGARLDLCDAWRALGFSEEDQRLRGAILRVLRRAARRPLRSRLSVAADRAFGRELGSGVGWSRTVDAFERHRTNTAISLLLYGRPYP